MSRIRRHPQAAEDLLDLWTYIAQDDLDAADRMLDRIQAKLDLVAQRPLIGRGRPGLADDLRSVTVGNAVIFSRPIPDGIALVRVVSRYRDLETAEFAPSSGHRDRGRQAAPGAQCTGRARRWLDWRRAGAIVRLCRSGPLSCAPSSSASPSGSRSA